jgi:hypothetical protein
VSLPVPAGGDLVGWLQAVAVCRLVEVPRPPVDAEPGAGRLQRDAAVVSGYHGAVAGDGVPLLAGWCRRRGDGPVDVLLGGAVLDRPGDAEAPLGLPPGGRGTPRAPGAGFAAFSALALGRPRYPGVTPRWLTLVDLQRTAEAVVDEVRYGPEVAANVRGFVLGPPRESAAGDAGPVLRRRPHPRHGGAARAERGVGDRRRRRP